MKKLFVILFAFVMMSTSVFAREPIQTEEMEISSFLSENNISLSLINELKDVYDTTKSEGNVVIGNFNDKMIEIKNLAETYNFSKEQIEDYIEGITSKPPVIVGSPEQTEISVMETPKSSRIGDDGIGYEVKSNDGYVKQTAFLTLPSVSITNEKNTSTTATSAYMFYSYEYGGNAIDIGLWYHYGDGGWGWRDTYLRTFADSSNQTYEGKLNVSAGDYLYLEAAIVYGNDGQRYIQYLISDGDNLNDVKANVAVWVGNYIGSSAIIDRQITLCNSANNFNTGEKIEGAIFESAKLFTSVNGNGVSVSSYNTNRYNRGRFGKFGNDYKQVKVIDYVPWYGEAIDIFFDATKQNVGE